MNVIFYACETFASGHIRGTVPAVELNRRGRVRMVVKTDVLYSDLPGTDAMVFQRQSSDAILEKIEQARAAGIVTLYDMDDDLFIVPEALGHPDSPKLLEYVAGLRRCMAAVDCVVCSTAELEKVVRAEMPEVRSTVVVENGLDLGDGNWDAQRIARVRAKAGQALDGRVTIGWYGSPAHARDAVQVGAVLAALMAKHDNLYLHFLGNIHTDDLMADLSGVADRVVNDRSWHDISMLPQAIRHFDIGLAVQVDNRFNRARSNIKWQEQAALEIPVCASAMPSYTGTITSGVDGFLCANEDEWFAALEGLIVDPALRASMGEAARKTLEDRFCVRVQAPRWERMFRELRNGVDFS